MASNKLAWHRDRIMQHEYGTGRGACWAAVIESALAFYKKATDYTKLTIIESKFEDAGGKIGEGGIKDFPAALRTFDLYDKHETSKTKFNGKYQQIFNFVKWQIDKANVVIVSFKVPEVTARHAGMIFGYNEPDGVYFIEPGSIAMLEGAPGAASIVFDDKMASHYTNNTIKIDALFTAQKIGSAAQQAAGKYLTMEANALYRIKAPSSANQGTLIPYVVNPAAGQHK